MANRGIFITFEGSEGCGKTTQMEFVRKFFESKGVSCVLSREPGGTAISEKIRDLLLDSRAGAGMSAKTEMLLFAAARAQHVDEKIRPALEDGKCVICDRFMDSTSAYQGAARKLGAEVVDIANQIAVGDCVPDITFLLDMDAELGLLRASARDSGKLDRMGSEKIAFYKEVRACYLELAKRFSERIVVIDASKSVEEVSTQIKEVLERKFK